MSAALLHLVRVGVVRERKARAASVDGPARAASILRAMLPEDREGFAVIHLDARHQPISVELVSVGTINASIVHPREVFKGALLANAYAIIVGHNHPSGDPTPSAEDESITKRLRDAGDIVGVALLDHIVIGRGQRSVSLRDRKMGGLQ